MMLFPVAVVFLLLMTVAASFALVITKSRRLHGPRQSRPAPGADVAVGRALRFLNASRSTSKSPLSAWGTAMRLLRAGSPVVAMLVPMMGTARAQFVGIPKPAPIVVTVSKSDQRMVVTVDGQPRGRLVTSVPQGAGRLRP